MCGYVSKKNWPFFCFWGGRKKRRERRKEKRGAVCENICVCVLVCLCICVCVFVFVYVYCVCVFVCLCNCICVCVVNLCLCLSVCACEGPLNCHFNFLSFEKNKYIFSFILVQRRGKILFLFQSIQ